MSNNIDVTAGAGTSVATDQVSPTNEHVQLLKVAYSAAGSRVLVQVDANGMLVNVGTSALPSGAATAARQDTGNVSIASVDTKTPALGQQLAAASSPVVLTAIQVAALTPPAAITGFGLEATQATAAKQDTAQTSLTAMQTSLTTVAAATHLEDVAVVDADRGIAMLAARQDDPSTPSTSASGDYQMLTTDAQGRIWVNASSVQQPINDRIGTALLCQTLLMASAQPANGFFPQPELPGFLTGL